MSQLTPVNCFAVPAKNIHSCNYENSSLSASNAGLGWICSLCKSLLPCQLVTEIYMLHIASSMPAVYNMPWCIRVLISSEKKYSCQILWPLGQVFLMYKHGWSIQCICILHAIKWTILKQFCFEKHLGFKSILPGFLQVVVRFAACFLKILLSCILPLIQWGIYFFPKVSKSYGFLWLC